ncbi:chondroitin proteoglycan 2-like [Cheilinus undulatus]|uniref:chondroitin proteoglycan 2-like n=1 Tax=Cheilinus undulatus TaxID=241271 RepID=UPI001BD2B8D0|nr:chondroitin proteoglycan 2-like [Cheilinus undulatus]
MWKATLTAGLCLILASLDMSGLIQAVTASSNNHNNCPGNSSFCDGKMNGNYANDDDPNCFYTCSNGNTYKVRCQSGLVFVEESNLCDYPDTTSTAPTTTTQTSTTTATTRAPCPGNSSFCDGKMNGNFANDDDPNCFYTCSNGNTFNFRCQSGLVFVEQENRCDYPDTISTTTTTQTSTTTATSTTPTTTTPTPTTTGAEIDILDL